MLEDWYSCLYIVKHIELKVMVLSSDKQSRARMIVPRHTANAKHALENVIGADSFTQ